MSSSLEPERGSDEETSSPARGGRASGIVAAGVLGIILIATIVVVAFSIRAGGSAASEAGTDLAAPLPAPSATPPGTPETSERVARALEKSQEQAPRPACPQGVLAGTVSEVTSATRIRIVAGDCSAAIVYASVRGFESATSTEEAAARNVALVSGRNVIAEPDVTGSLGSGMRVSHVFVGDLLVSEQLVRLGVLRVDTESPDALYRGRLIAAQEEARNARRGGWRTSTDSVPSPNAVVVAESEFRGAVEIVAIDPLGEVVTIRNASGATIDIGDWELAASDFPTTFRFSGGTKLQPGASMQIVSGVPGAPPNRLFWTPEQVWRDDQSDSAQIFDSDNRLVSSYPP